jgi:hypothetical protein
LRLAGAVDLEAGLYWHWKPSESSEVVSRIDADFPF